jgi:hypothetical protein
MHMYTLSIDIHVNVNKIYLHFMYVYKVHNLHPCKCITQDVYV